MRHEGVPPSNNLIKDDILPGNGFRWADPEVVSFSFFFAPIQHGAFMEVKVMDTRKILSAIGTFAVVGAVSTAGAALWTKVLNRKFQMVQLKLTHPKSDKIIFVDFKKAKRGR